MAVFDTHKAYVALTAGGFTDSQAKTLLDTFGDSNEALATKTDIGTVKTDLRELELRMRLHLYGAAIVVIGVLAALALLPR